MKKADRFTALLSLVLTLGLSAQVGASNAATKTSRAISSQNLNHASPLAQRGSRAGAPRFAKRLIRENNRRRQYKIDASYPELVGANNPSVVQFNRAAKELVIREVNDFRKNAAPPDPPIPGMTMGSYLDAGYTIEHRSADLISVSFGFNTYYAGAAHPNNHSLVLNYDLKAGRALALSDLFKPRSQHMQVISDYAIKALKKELGADADAQWIATGAAPDSKNYRSWTITSRGLSFTFDAYQVAAYAYGPQFVVIPYADLRNVINPDGPLGPLTRQSPVRRGGR